jgi:hypothetical protein
MAEEKKSLCKNADFHVKQTEGSTVERTEKFCILSVAPGAHDYHVRSFEDTKEAALAYIRIHRKGEPGHTYKITNKEGGIV